MSNQEDESTCPCAAPESGESSNNKHDYFRRKERAIKLFMKSTQDTLENKSKKQKYWKSDEASASSDSFSWENDVVDIHSKIGVDNVTLKKQFDRCFSTHSHNCTRGSTIYQLNNGPDGLFIISNVLCCEEQVYWAKTALEVYSTVEHTNLTNLAKLQTESEPSSEQKHDSTSFDNLWFRSVDENNNFSSFNKLRWSCLGYHYDWTKRAYQKNLKSVFPTDLAELCQFIASELGNDFSPEAAIVNFYPMSTSMGGHLDDAEHDLRKPIVSLSLGCSALFLIGGKDKTVNPTPILVRSGDSIVMTGESRLCYHGVPCIISRDVESYLCDVTLDPLNEVFPDADPATKNVLSYLKDHRINMNVRQVKYEADEDAWVDKAGTGHVKYAP